jgi:hypothetical protein
MRTWLRPYPLHLCGTAISNFSGTSGSGLDSSPQELGLSCNPLQADVPLFRKNLAWTESSDKHAHEHGPQTSYNDSLCIHSHIPTRTSHVPNQTPNHRNWAHIPTLRISNPATGRYPRSASNADTRYSHLRAWPNVARRAERTRRTVHSATQLDSRR